MVTIAHVDVAVMGISMTRLMTTVGAFALLGLVGVAEAAPRLESSIVPSVRSIAAGSSATAFAVLINSGDVALTNCRPVYAGNLQGITFSYQTTNASNQLSGTANTAVSLAASASQNFVIQVNAAGNVVADTYGPDIQFKCNNGATTVVAPVRSSINSFTVSVGPNAPDIIPIIATSTPGVAEATTLGGFGVLAAAAVNIGAAGTIGVVPAASLGDLSPYVDATICETNSSGACLAAPSAFVNTTFGANQTKTFSAFFRQSGADPTQTGTPYMPDAVRAGLLFGSNITDVACAQNATLRGEATVAFRSPDPQKSTTLRDGYYQFVFDDTATRGRSIAQGYYFSSLQRFFLTLTGDAFSLTSQLVPGAFGLIDAIAAGAPNPTIFSDARLVVQRFTGIGTGIDNQSVILGDTASAGHKFTGLATSGTGTNPIPTTMNADFRSLFTPLFAGAVVKSDYPGAYTPMANTTDKLTMTLAAAGAGQPMTFTGSLAGTGSGSCTVSGKLTPVDDTTLPYIAELTVNAGTCAGTFGAGTYDGYALLSPPSPATTSCGVPVAASPRQIFFQFSPLARGARTAVPTTTPTLRPVIVQR